MKKIISLMLALVLLMFCGCAYKSTPAIKIKHDSVEKIEFKRTEFSTDDPLARNYVKKTVINENDITSIIKWIEKLELIKHEAIEIPVEEVKYVITLCGVKDHTLIFYDKYVVYDNTAFTFEKASQQQQVSEKYNLLNYEEQTTELDLI